MRLRGSDANHDPAVGRSVYLSVRLEQREREGVIERCAAAKGRRSDAGSCGAASF